MVKKLSWNMIKNLQKQEKILDQGIEYDALLTELFKAFDYFPHDLIFAKLHTSSLSLKSFKLTDRKQSFKTNDHVISCMNIGLGIQGSVLGLLLFNIFLRDMFLFCNEIDFASYADNNSPFHRYSTAEEVLGKLQKSSKSTFECFESNGMKANPEKCHLILSKKEDFEANTNENNTSNTKYEKLLGVTFDYRLNLNHHISNICEMASNKLNALDKFQNYMNDSKRRIFFN